MDVFPEFSNWKLGSHIIHWLWYFGNRVHLTPEEGCSLVSNLKDIATLLFLIGCSSHSWPESWFLLEPLLSWMCFHIVLNLELFFLTGCLTKAREFCPPYYFTHSFEKEKKWIWVFFKFWDLTWAHWFYFLYL